MNTNVYNTETQFYINDIIELRQHPLPARYSNSNVNSNNYTPQSDESATSLINTFNTRVLTETAPEPQSVVNLSSRSISQDELEILSLGKGFCPTPGEPNMGEIKSDLDRLHTKCRTKLFFDKLDAASQSRPNPLRPSFSSPAIPTTSDPAPTESGGKNITGGFSANLFKEKIFRKTTKWIPPRGPPTFETFAILNEIALSKTSIKAPANRNLTTTAKSCLKRLARDTDIVI